MSQLNSMAIPMEGKYSKIELLELKNKMNAKALAKRRSKTALRLAANIIFAILVLLPLLYAVSIALMPSNELFSEASDTAELQGGIYNCSASPVHFKFIYHGRMYYHRTDHFLFPCRICIFLPGI